VIVVKPEIKAPVGTREYLEEEQALYDKAIINKDWETVWRCLYNATQRYIMWNLNEKGIKYVPCIQDKTLDYLCRIVAKLKYKDYHIRTLKYCSFFALNIVNWYYKKQERFERSALSIYKYERKLIGAEDGIYYSDSDKENSYYEHDVKHL